MSIIKFSQLRSVLHDSVSFSKRSEEFITSINKELDSNLILAKLDDYDCDLKLIFIESGGSEMLFKEKMKELKEPFYFLTSGDNNSLAATLEILTYLNTIGKKGEILHGPISYIANRINELTNKKQIKLLEGQRYGVIGVPSDWLIASIPEYELIRNKFGAELININLEEVIENYNKAKCPLDVNNLNFDKEEVKKAEKFNLVLEEIVKKYQLDGLTIRCFDLLNTIFTTGCLSLASLNKKGIIATCEGDIMAMLSMALVKKISNQSSFQANPSRIDIDKNEILFAHCTVPYDMLTSYQYKTHFESGIGVAVKGELEEKLVTVFRFSKDLKNYFVSRGEITKNLNEENLCRTQIVVKLEKDVRDLLVNPCGNHHIIFYGDYVEVINQLFS